MTRFARRKQHLRGKKGNKQEGHDDLESHRTPEEPTPWVLMVAGIKNQAPNKSQADSGSSKEITESEDNDSNEALKKKSKIKKRTQGNARPSDSTKEVTDSEDDINSNEVPKKKCKMKKTTGMQGNDRPICKEDALKRKGSDEIPRKKGKKKKRTNQTQGNGSFKEGAIKSTVSDEMDQQEIPKKKQKKDNEDDNTDIFRKIREQSRQEHDPNKPYTFTKFYGNGGQVKLGKFEGYTVTPEDARRLEELKADLMSRGMPRETIFQVMKLERRKAEKLMKRTTKNMCFRCRQPGHNMSRCPELDTRDEASGVCYICGSADHSIHACPSKGKTQSSQSFDFAKCFVCGEKGHISRQCPDNPKGIYPMGGACLICGDVTHLRRDCPTLQKHNHEHRVTAERIFQSKHLEDIDAVPIPFLPNDTQPRTSTNKSIVKKKVVKF